MNIHYYYVQNSSSLVKHKHEKYEENGQHFFMNMDLELYIGKNLFNLLTAHDR